MTAAHPCGMSLSRRWWLGPAVGLGGAALARQVLRRARRTSLRDQVALVTGSSRGLGLALARELADHGCRIVMCARDPDELERARQDIARRADVLAVTCDVSDRDDVRRMLRQAVDHFGRIDVLVNNAGSITVGPLDTQTVADFDQAMRVMFWGALYPTLELLPAMRARRAGHIVNITSIGGKISVPHLVPYSAAKFAAVGLSEGLHAELSAEGVHVLTVVPGLMRTGSHLNAEFKGQNEAEFGWFSLSATLPLTSMSAEAAARQILDGLEHGESEIILSWQASIAARVHGLMPGLTSEVLGLVDRLLPASGGGIGARKAAGRDSQSALTRSPLETLGQQAAERLNQA
jgi:short-subunit dehydrogenase